MDDNILRVCVENNKRALDCAGRALLSHIVQSNTNALELDQMLNGNGQWGKILSTFSIDKMSASEYLCELCNSASFQISPDNLNFQKIDLLLELGASWHQPLKSSEGLVAAVKTPFDVLNDDTLVSNSSSKVRALALRVKERVLAIEENKKLKDSFTNAKPKMNRSVVK